RAPGASGPLVRRGLGDFLDVQGPDAAPVVKGGATLQARVDDETDAIDGDGGLGDIGGHDDLGPSSRRDGGVLGGGRELPVQGVQIKAGTPAGALEGVQSSLDFVATRQ